MHPRDDRSQCVNLGEEVDLEMVLPCLDVQLRACDLAGRFQYAGIQDDAADMAKGLPRGRDGSFKSSSVSTGSKWGLLAP